LWNKVKEFFTVFNPTLVLTLLYLYATAIGIVYSRVLYARFGINIFDYSETTDFLLAAFRNPIAFLVAGILIVLGAAYVALLRSRVRSYVQKQPRYRKGKVTTDEDKEEMEGRVRFRARTSSELKELEGSLWKSVRKQVVLLGIILPITAIVLTSVILPYVSATRTAISIKHGEQPAIDVRYRAFSGSAGQVSEPDLELIGATQKAVFFYDVDEKRTIVIPQTQIVSIEVPEQQ
jgi:hypothetical protein